MTPLIRYLSGLVYISTFQLVIMVVVVLQNISQAPTKQLVAKCLAEGDECDRRNDALELMKQWETIIANCQSETEQQEKELVEAIYNIDYNSYR